VEAKFGKDYRKEIEEILSEATISHRKRAGENSEYFG